MSKNVDIDIVSPCVGICQLDENNQCKGCLRTLSEIRLWGKGDNAVRLDILQKLKQRRIRIGRVGSRDLSPRRRRRSLPS